jgi:hypothetical protein
MALILFAHRGNIKRLAHGNENRLPFPNGVNRLCVALWHNNHAKAAELAALGLFAEQHAGRKAAAWP